MAPMSPKYVSARRPHRDRGEKAPEYPREVPKQKAKSAAIEKTEFLAEGVSAQICASPQQFQLPKAETAVLPPLPSTPYARPSRCKEPQSIAAHRRTSAHVYSEEDRRHSILP